MQYIWINPVVKQMYDKEVLESLLERHGYQQVSCRQDWGYYVCDSYGRLAEVSGVPVADVRCPSVSKLLRENYKQSPLLIPEIEPILIHCAREISERTELKGKKKLIITPCQALARMGTQCQLPDTCFLTWKQFLIEIKEHPKAKQLNASPIPPGFFQSLNCPSISITGASEICTYLEKNRFKNIGVIELLWCRDGCHHGDGVINLE